MLAIVIATEKDTRLQLIGSLGRYQAWLSQLNEALAWTTCRSCWRSRRHLSARFLFPSPEDLGASLAIVGDGHEMSPWTKVAIDHALR